MSFDHFKLHGDIIEGIHAMGYSEPTPVQNEVIPLILEHRDLIACAQTGTGKTAAYLLPILDKIHSTKKGEIIDEDAHISDPGNINTLVIVPTRELAVQIDQQVDGFGYYLDISSYSVYGGVDGISWDKQKRALKEGADVIIATPGKLLSHLSFDYVNFDHLQHLVLDEADRMLDMGFYDDIMKIISYMPEKRQNMLFSATMPAKIRQLAKKILSNPAQINIAIAKPASGILQAAYIVGEDQKIGLIEELVKKKKLNSVLIFCSTKKNVRNIAKLLKDTGFKAEGISSDLDQTQREEVLRNFKNREIQMLVATDIVARGIDIVGIKLIINYNIPNDSDDYVHRVGRTARADHKGVALTFINPKEHEEFKRIEDVLGIKVQRLPLPASLGPAPDVRSGSRPGYKKPWRSKSNRNYPKGKKNNRFRSEKKHHSNKGQAGK